MPTIHLTTFIAAPKERVFDLSRSIDLHRKSMAHTGEEAVGGTITGLINHLETVTWKAKHLGKTRYLKSKITEMKRPDQFTDEMVQGDFRALKHEHHFKSIENGTLVMEYLHYEMPYGFLGKLTDRFYLNKYLTKLLENRNAVIKKCAESNDWKQYIG